MDEDTALAQHVLTLPAWQCDLTIISMSDGPYLLVRQLCGVLGIADVQQQIEQLRERKVIRPYLRQIAVQTRGGRQKAWCIHRRAIGFWWGFISDKRVRPAVAERLIELQQDILDAADRLLFGEVPSDPIRGQVMQLDGQMAALRRLTLTLETRVGRLEDRIVLPESDT